MTVTTKQWPSLFRTFKNKPILSLSRNNQGKWGPSKNFLLHSMQGIKMCCSSNFCRRKYRLLGHLQFSRSLARPTTMWYRLMMTAVWRWLMRMMTWWLLALRRVVGTNNDCIHSLILSLNYILIINNKINERKHSNNCPEAQTPSWVQPRTRQQVTTFRTYSSSSRWDDYQQQKQMYTYL